MEIWKAINGWEGFYEVSTSGRVRSLTRTIIARNHWGALAPRTYRGRVLDDHVSKGGYRIVALSRPGQKPISHNVHTLVLTTFLGEPPAGFEACHGPAGPTVNDITNLRWDTRQMNALDRHQYGRPFTPDRGVANRNAKLTDAEVRHIREMRGVVTQRTLGWFYDVGHSVIGHIQRRQAWAHVT